MAGAGRPVLGAELYKVLNFIKFEVVARRPEACQVIFIKIQITTFELYKAHTELYELYKVPWNFIKRE